MNKKLGHVYNRLFGESNKPFTHMNNKRLGKLNNSKSIGNMNKRLGHANDRLFTNVNGRLLEHMNNKSEINPKKEF
jgi:hypothetical protein